MRAPRAPPTRLPTGARNTPQERRDAGPAALARGLRRPRSLEGQHTHAKRARERHTSSSGATGAQRQRSGLALTLPALGIVPRACGQPYSGDGDRRAVQGNAQTHTAGERPPPCNSQTYKIKKIDTKQADDPPTLQAYASNSVEAD